MNQEQSGTVQNRSRPVLAHWNKGQKTVKHNFAALSMYSWGIPCARNGQERSGTVPNGSWLTGFVRIAGMFWHFLAFQYEELCC